MMGCVTDESIVTKHALTDSDSTLITSDNAADECDRRYTSKLYVTLMGSPSASKVCAEIAVSRSDNSSRLGATSTSSSVLCSGSDWPVLREKKIGQMALYEELLAVQRGIYGYASLPPSAGSEAGTTEDQSGMLLFESDCDVVDVRLREEELEEACEESAEDAVARVLAWRAAVKQEGSVPLLQPAPPAAETMTGEDVHTQGRSAEDRRADKNEETTSARKEDTEDVHQKEEEDRKMNEGEFPIENPHDTQNKANAMVGSKSLSPDDRDSSDTSIELTPRRREVFNAVMRHQRHRGESPDTSNTDSEVSLDSVADGELLQLLDQIGRRGETLRKCVDETTPQRPIRMQRMNSRMDESTMQAVRHLVRQLQRMRTENKEREYGIARNQVNKLTSPTDSDSKEWQTDDGSSSDAQSEFDLDFEAVGYQVLNPDDDYCFYNRTAEEVMDCAEAVPSLDSSGKHSCNVGIQVGEDGNCPLQPATELEIQSSTDGNISIEEADAPSHASDLLDKILRQMSLIGQTDVSRDIDLDKNADDRTMNPFEPPEVVDQVAEEDAKCDDDSVALAVEEKVFALSGSERDKASENDASSLTSYKQFENADVKSKPSPSKDLQASEVTELRGQLCDMQRTVTVARDENVRLSRRLDEALGEVRCSLSNHSQGEAPSMDLQRKLDSLQCDQMELETSLSILRQKQTDDASQEVTLDGAISDNDALRHQVELLHTEYARLRSSLASMETILHLQGAPASGLIRSLDDMKQHVFGGTENKEQPLVHDDIMQKSKVILERVTSDEVPSLRSVQQPLVVAQTADDERLATLLGKMMTELQLKESQASFIQDDSSIQVDEGLRKKRLALLLEAFTGRFEPAVLTPVATVTEKSAAPEWSLRDDLAMLMSQVRAEGQQGSAVGVLEDSRQMKNRLQNLREELQKKWALPAAELQSCGPSIACNSQDFSLKTPLSDKEVFGASSKSDSLNSDVALQPNECENESSNNNAQTLESHHNNGLSSHQGRGENSSVLSAEQRPWSFYYQTQRDSTLLHTHNDEDRVLSNSYNKQPRNQGTASTESREPSHLGNQYLSKQNFPANDHANSQHTCSYSPRYNTSQPIRTTSCDSKMDTPDDHANSQHTCSYSPRYNTSQPIRTTSCDSKMDTPDAIETIAPRQHSSQSLSHDKDNASSTNIQRRQWQPSTHEYATDQPIVEKFSQLARRLKKSVSNFDRPKTDGLSDSDVSSVEDDLVVTRSGEIKLRSLCTPPTPRQSSGMVESEDDYLADHIPLASSTKSWRNKKSAQPRRLVEFAASDDSVEMSRNVRFSDEPGRQAPTRSCSAPHSLTTAERKYADELIDHYAFAWERSHRVLQSAAPSGVKQMNYAPVPPRQHHSDSPSISDILQRYKEACQK